MSIETMTVLGFTASKDTIFNLSGLFGGCFPLMFDLLHRHKQVAQQKIDLNFEFWCIKGLLIPVGALIITALCVASGNIPTWFAALYLGATLPALVEKLVSVTPQQVKLPPGA